MQDAVNKKIFSISLYNAWVFSALRHKKIKNQNYFWCRSLMLYTPEHVHLIRTIYLTRLNYVLGGSLYFFNKPDKEAQHTSVLQYWRHTTRVHMKSHPRAHLQFDLLQKLHFTVTLGSEQCWVSPLSHTQFLL